MMRSPALDSSDSREMPYVLRKEKKLRYNADGSNNLVEWIPDVIPITKAAQPAFHKALVDRAIPPEWETPFPAPDPADYAAMSEYERDCLKDDRQQHERTRQNWKVCKPAFCTWLLANISDSSEKRVKEQEHAAFDTAKEADAIVTLFTLLISSHNFYGQTASLKEQTDVRHKHDYFSWISPELLSHFKLRWDELIKEATRVGIDGELSDKNRFYHFSVALVKYGHSDLVRRESAQRAAHIDVNADYDIDDHYQTCIRLARIDTDTSTGTPNLREPDTALAATIGQQLKNPGRSGKGHSSDDSSVDSGSTTGSSASSGNSNTATQVYIERQKKATGKERKGDQVQHRMQQMRQEGSYRTRLQKQRRKGAQTISKSIQEHGKPSRIHLRLESPNRRRGSR